MCFSLAIDRNKHLVLPREGTEGHDSIEFSKFSISLMITGIVNPQSNTLPYASIQEFLLDPVGSCWNCWIFRLSGTYRLYPYSEDIASSCI
jgi:hypothetical protein